MLKKLIIAFILLTFVGIALGVSSIMTLSADLPQIISREDYKPLLVSTVFDRNGKEIGEFARGERRTLVEYENIPTIVVQAFISAEDSSFFQHNGVNLKAIGRAFIANLKARKKVQGGSTITQQIAKTLLLTRRKTYLRKIKEVLLARRMEKHLSKEDILYLYLNQIYLGQGAYGVAKACETYFKKPLSEITLAEAALLAGLTPAPSRYNPAHQPRSAKIRQKYVLLRMVDMKYITLKEAIEAQGLPLEVFIRKGRSQPARYYLETIRQTLVKHVGEEPLLDKGLRIYTGLDIDKQIKAEKYVQEELRALDKRQGFRRAKAHLDTPEAINNFLLESRDKFMDKAKPVRILLADGTFNSKGDLNLTRKDKEGNDLPNIPDYLSIDQIITGIVTNVDDQWGLVTVDFTESQGLIDIDSMTWARSPNPQVKWIYSKIKKPSQALKVGDVINISIKDETFSSPRIEKILQKLKSQKKQKYERPEELPDFEFFVRLELEQEPTAEASLISIDHQTSDILSMVGGYDFKRSKFNRTYQAQRQTGSSFKTFVYAAALDHGYHPATPIVDAPIVFEEPNTDSQNSAPNEGEDDLLDDSPSEQNSGHIKTWKPKNHSKRFMGDILFRNALIHSRNVPAVKIIKKIGIDLTIDYARRLGIFSPLNMDYTLALGSSSVTLYEMTKAFSHIANLGQRIKPILIHRVIDGDGNILAENLSLDDRFEEEIQAIEDEFEQRRQEYLSQSLLEQQKNEQQTIKEQNRKQENDGFFSQETDMADNSEEKEPPKEPAFKESPLFFKDPNQLIKPSTAYLVTTLLRGAIEEGTGRKARALGRPAAGKTGSTSGYFDGWFIGYTPQITTGVWVGHDREQKPWNW